MRDPKIAAVKVTEDPIFGVLADIEFEAQSPTDKYAGRIDFSSLAAMDAFISNLQLWRSRLAAAFPICELPGRSFTVNTVDPPYDPYYDRKTIDGILPNPMRWPGDNRPRNERMDPPPHLPEIGC